MLQAATPPPPLHNPQWDLFALEWQVDRAGYAIAKDENTLAVDYTAGRRTPLAPLVLHALGGKATRYHPSDFPLLHREFAAAATDAALIDFCALYGLPEPGERISLHLIHEQRDALRNALAKIDTAVKLDEKEKARRKDLPGDALARLAPWTSKAAPLFNAGAPLAYQLHLDPHTTRMRIVPTTLYAWMWIKVAEEIAGGPQWKACANCGKPIYIGGRGQRRDTKTCSGACRVAMVRRTTRS